MLAIGRQVPHIRVTRMQRARIWLFYTAPQQE